MAELHILCFSVSEYEGYLCTSVLIFTFESGSADCERQQLIWKVDVLFNSVPFCVCEHLQIVKVICISPPPVTVHCYCCASCADVESPTLLDPVGPRCRNAASRQQPSSSKELNPDVAPSANGQSGLFFFSLPPVSIRSSYSAAIKGIQLNLKMSDESERICCLLIISCLWYLWMCTKETVLCVAASLKLLFSFNRFKCSLNNSVFAVSRWLWVPGYKTTKALRGICYYVTVEKYVHIKYNIYLPVIVAKLPLSEQMGILF